MVGKSLMLEKQLTPANFVQTCKNLIASDQIVTGQQLDSSIQPKNVTLKTSNCSATVFTNHVTPRIGDVRQINRIGTSHKR